MTNIERVRDQMKMVGAGARFKKIASIRFTTSVL